MPETYLFFDGNCADAMHFYEKTFPAAKLQMMMTNDQAPPGSPVPPGNEKRIMHASLIINGKPLMASDAMAGEPYRGMEGFFVSLSFPEIAEARRVFDALGAGGKVIMPMDKTFWVEAFGMLRDRFGVPWMINGGKATM
jgi:Uncharacterized protein conserved in bacteria